MTEPTKKIVTRDIVEQNLPARYRSELRFRTAGIVAIVISVIILVLLIGSIALKSLPAYTVWQINLPVALDQELVDPDGDVSETSIRQGSYGRVLQNGMRETFPDVSGRSDLRSLFQLYTALNSTRLMDRVIEDPDLVGTDYVFTMPLGDDLDLYLKGMLVEDRSFAMDGVLVIEPGRRRTSVQSQNADFAAVLAELQQMMVDEAMSLEGRAAANRLLASSVDAEETTRLEEEADRFDQRAQALRTDAAGAEGQLELSDDLPSVIVEYRGAAIRLDRLDLNGQGGSGVSILSIAEDRVEDNWTLYIVDTPQARRRIPDNQLIWTRALVERGVVSQAFNHYFFTNADSREPELAGIRGALNGSVLTLIITLLLSIPVGIATAIYLEEYAPKNKFTDLIEVNINNLAAVPSIIFGLLGVAIFIDVFGLPRGTPVLGGMVLSLMTLPTIIIATRASLKAVPPSIRQAALGVGASRTQSIFHHVLPLATPGILTGSIIGLSRALGETAPLLMIGMVAFIADAPKLSLEGFTEPATVLPVQIYLWYSAAERAFEPRAAAAIIVLLALIISFNAVAVYLRRKFERRW
jgi:phosphate transport system permease protein